MQQTPLFALIMLTVLSGCQSNSSSALRGTEVNLRYAEIRNIARVQMPSAAPAGAIVGGFTGLVLSQRSRGSRQIASGVGGAVLGGLAARALEGDNRGYSYRLRYMDGQESNFITEKGYLLKGDCVVVESGTHQNIRRVSSSMCAAYPDIRVPIELHRYGANECSQAKRELLIAQGQDAARLAATKVEVLCHF